MAKEYNYSYSTSKGKRIKKRFVATKSKNANEVKANLKKNHPEYHNLRISKKTKNLKLYSAPYFKVKR